MSPTTGTATIVFTDLAGSTELRAGLGERAGDDLRRGGRQAHRVRLVCDSRVELSMSVNKNVTVPDGRGSSTSELHPTAWYAYAR